MGEIATKICLESKRLIRTRFMGSIVCSLLLSLAGAFDSPFASAEAKSTKPSQGTASSGVKTATASTSSKKKQGKRRVARKRGPRGQQEIEASRVTEIQNALATAGFYKEPSSGKWDPSTTQAMSAYQESNGFKVTGKPDALSLKKLGL
jgi:peptidoglycan hydrolase-like protein with peptidoglycan-binding domain